MKYCKLMKDAEKEENAGKTMKTIEKHGPNADGKRRLKNNEKNMKHRWHLKKVVFMQNA